MKRGLAIVAVAALACGFAGEAGAQKNVRSPSGAKGKAPARRSGGEAKAT